MARVTGLDIGTFGVRAAEIETGSGVPKLTRFGQVALPAGAVSEGMVADAEAVGAAIRRLWREGGFRTKSVVIGVANQGVIVRPAEMARMSPADLTQAIQFEAEELIPIPIEDALLDFQILDDFVSPDGDPRMRILLAAAQRDMVRDFLVAAERGGLEAQAVDPIPFALVRALAPTAVDTALGDGAADAIVSLGGGITTMVAHQSGVPTFARIQQTGGDQITEAISRELGVDLDAAEDLKRRVGRGPSGTGTESVEEAAAARIVASRVADMADEIRNSLEFYSGQADAPPLRRVLLTGGASRTAGLLDRLQQNMFIPVEMGRPLSAVEVGDVGIDPSRLAEAEPLLTAAIGLALAGTPLAKGERRISLLPREVTLRREQHRQAVLVSSAVGALAVLLLLLWVLAGSRLADERKKADQAEARAQQLEQQAAALRDITALDDELAQRSTAIQAALAGDIAWTRFIQEVATVMPGDVWLTGFSGSAGAVNFSLMGFDHTSTARWIMRMSGMPSLSTLWVPASNKNEGPPSTVTFTSSASLTPVAESGRAAEFAPERNP
ncbi:MAG TPA: type IV pilus assembly protein PilM [Acidimicrobiales bacterium]|nr:type IV pilus assembly protein PilM [Acidimicrobiales bacterium]